MSRFTLQHTLPTWRRLAVASWKQADDPSIFGWVDIDATALLAYVERWRAETGVHVTLTHVVGKAAAMAFAAHPECNAVAARGTIAQRETVDVFFSVAAGKDLTGAKLERVDGLSVDEIARRLEKNVSTIRTKGDTELQQSQARLKRLPSWLLGPAMRAVAVATFDLGLDLTRLGVPFDPFGTVVVTNVGVFGIEQGFAPLIPSGRTSALLTIGKIRDKVIACDGRPAVRPVLTIGGSFDHRVVDGWHLGRISEGLKHMLEAPEVHLGVVPSTQPARRDVATQAAPLA
jgi:pyruvate dehydrogenase E2 component (dihydrolipoamide acetyltransferase)